MYWTVGRCIVGIGVIGPVIGYSTSPEGTRCGGPDVMINRSWLAIREAVEAVGLPDTLIRSLDDVAGPAEGATTNTSIRITNNTETRVNGRFMAIISCLFGYPLKSVIRIIRYGVNLEGAFRRDYELNPGCVKIDTD